MKVRKHGKKSLMDGKEHGPLKERMKAMEMKAGQESGVELKAQESGSRVMHRFY